MPSSSAMAGSSVETPGPGPCLQWVVEDGLQTIRLLVGQGHTAIISDSQTCDTFGKALRVKSQEYAANLEKKFDFEIFKINSLKDDIEELAGKKIDYILLILNSGVQSCLDMAESEFSRMHLLFHATRRVELYLTRTSSTTSHISNTQLRTFCDRYKDPPVSKIQFDDKGAIVNAVTILYNRLKHLKNSGL